MLNSKDFQKNIWKIYWIFYIFAPQMKEEVSKMYLRTKKSTHLASRRTTQLKM